MSKRRRRRWFDRPARGGGSRALFVAGGPGVNVWGRGKDLTDLKRTAGGRASERDEFSWGS